MKLSALISTIATAGLAVASAIPRANLLGIISRQTPSECAFYCSPMTDIDKTCDLDPSCICSPIAAAVLYTCASCELKTKGDTFSSLQGTLN
ncbi:hypothetical protein FS837_008912, partial [Tulasnella sp. UAMH 9824]